MRAPYLYEERLKDAIQLIKYAGKSYVVNSLGALLGTFAKNWINETKEMVMVPVPLHRKKIRQRGYNQSVLLARAVSPILGVETDFFTLTRTRFTGSQTGLSTEQRRKNVKGAFEVIDNNSLKGKTVVLVDDVATTGSTVNECSRILKKGGLRLM